MNTVALNNFNFSECVVDKKVDEDKFFNQYRNFMNVWTEQNESVAAVVHALLLPLNGPKSPASTKKKMEDYLAALYKKWTSDVPESQRIPKEYLKLTGNNPFASAVKKILGAVEHGGDLTVLDSVSKCEKHRREKNKEKNKTNALNLITAEQRAILMEESPDLQPDTPAFLEELKKRVDAVTGTADIKAGKEDDGGEKVKTPLDLALEDLCATYRAIAEIHGNETQAIEMAISDKKALMRTLDKLREQVSSMLKTGT